jgi:hypothetical protein
MKRSLCVMAVALGGLVTQGQLPEIYDISPRAARPGESLRIIGQDFDPVAANNVVYIGGVPARVTRSWVTELEVEVPRAAQEGTITVATGGKIAVGPIPFQPLFAPFGQSNAVYRRMIQLPAFDYAGLATADLNRDGGAELLCVTRDARVDLFEYVPGGQLISLDSLQLRTQLAGTIGNTNVLMVDFDADGRIDILMAGRSGFDLFRNIHESGPLGAGSFAPPVNVIQSHSFDGDFRLADLNRDGRMDLITRDSGGRVTFNLNTYDPNSTNQWLTSRSLIWPSTFFSGRHMAVGDLNRDGHADVVIASGDSLRIFSHNSRSGTNIQFTQIQIPTASTFVQLMDVEGDGSLDILVYNPIGQITGDYVVLWNKNNGGHLEASDFEPVQLVQREFSQFRPNVLDVNGDGYQDILRGTFGRGEYFENQSRFLTNIIFPGSFLTKTNILTNSPVVITVDLNRDGAQDVIMHQGVVSVYQNITLLGATVARITVYGTPLTYRVGIIGRPNEFVTIQSSSNLTAWQDAGTVRLGTPNSWDSSSGPATAQMQFFRIRPAP